MRLKLTGYAFLPSRQFQQELMSRIKGLAEGAPGGPTTPVRPIYADTDGSQFITIPSEIGVTTLPFISGSPADKEHGGFTPSQEMLQAGGDTGGIHEMLAGRAQSLPTQMVSRWLGKAATNALLAGEPVGLLLRALSTLGVSNPFMNTAIGGALDQTAGGAGHGPAGGPLRESLDRMKGIRDDAGKNFGHSVSRNVSAFVLSAIVFRRGAML